MDLYKIMVSPESTGYGLMARDPEGYCFVYSANTELWHRSGEQEVDFEFDREAVYEPIDAATAEALRPGVRPVDRRSMGAYVRDLEALPPKWTKTSAEVGLVSDTTRSRPLSAPVVKLALSRSKGSWTAAVNYPEERRTTAQKLASDLRRNRRKSFGPAAVEAKIVRKPGKIVSVLVRPERSPAAQTRAGSKN